MDFLPRCSRYIAFDGMDMKNITAGGLVLVAIAAVFCLGRYTNRQPDDGRADGGSNTQSAAVRLERRSTVLAQGRLEPAGGILNLGALPGEQIEKILVREGNEVSAGDVLAELTSRKFRRIETELSRLQLVEAERRLETEQKAADARQLAAQISLRNAELQLAQLEGKRGGLALLERQLAQGQRDLKRLDGLLSDERTEEVVTQQQMEQQRLFVDKLDNDLQQARIDLESAVESANLAIDAAKADLNMASVAAQNVASTIPTGSLQKKSELADQQFAMTQITSPIKATVIRTFLREKELIGNTPIFQLAATDDMVCVAEVYESNLRFIAKGQKVTINSPALPKQITGVVTSKGSVIGSPKLKNPSPLARVDRRTAEVQIKLDADCIDTAKQFISLQVNVKIDTSSGAM